MLLTTEKTQLKRNTGFPFPGNTEEFLLFAMSNKIWLERFREPKFTGNPTVILAIMRPPKHNIDAEIGIW